MVFSAVMSETTFFICICSCGRQLASGSVAWLGTWSASFMRERDMRALVLVLGAPRLQYELHWHIL